MTDLFDKFDALIRTREAMPFEEANPVGIVMDEIISPTEAVIEGRRTILAGTNNYLGLTLDPRCVAAAHEALDAAGTGTTGSRVLNGTYAGHKALEDAIAKLYGRAGRPASSTVHRCGASVRDAPACTARASSRAVNAWRWRGYADNRTKIG